MSCSLLQSLLKCKARAEEAGLRGTFAVFLSIQMLWWLVTAPVQANSILKCCCPDRGTGEHGQFLAVQYSCAARSCLSFQHCINLLFFIFFLLELYVNSVCAVSKEPHLLDIAEVDSSRRGPASSSLLHVCGLRQCSYCDVRQRLSHIPCSAHAVLSHRTQGIRTAVSCKPYEILVRTRTCSWNQIPNL